MPVAFIPVLKRNTPSASALEELCWNRNCRNPL